MKLILVSAVLALSVGLEPSASQGQIAPRVPDLSGQWNRDPASVGSADDAKWGPRVEISQTGSDLTVRAGSGKPERYRLDGPETAEVLWVDGCLNRIRITKAVSGRDKLTITAWLVIKSGCFHGEDEDDPFVKRTGAIALSEVLGARKLESITDVYRDGDTLTVDTTRANPGSSATSTTTTYRR